MCDNMPPCKAQDHTRSIFDHTYPSIFDDTCHDMVMVLDWLHAVRGDISIIAA